MNQTKDPKIGRFLFDSLTLGMYDDPLCVFREYIQNSADAIDKAINSKALSATAGEISINIDEINRIVKIEDNGAGINSKDAGLILESIGDSNKAGLSERGFRGIGRLGGMAYCAKLIFETTTANDKKITVNEWDCLKIADMLNPLKKEHKGAVLQDIIKSCSSVRSIEDVERKADHYFKVELHNVNRAQDKILNVSAVRDYISQVAPVPFNHQKFPFGKQIDEKFRKEIHNFNIFHVIVNYEEVFKPYTQTVHLGKGKTDTIKDIVDIDVKDKAGKIIAKGWRGDRNKLDAAILKTELVDGIRVRTGNILIGDEDLLDDVFKEKRFNAWFIGEIHTMETRLVPNARRDDFEEDNDGIRKTFYSSIKRDIGYPLSDEIRVKSKHRSKEKVVKKAEQMLLKVKDTAGIGFVGKDHRNDTIKNVKDVKKELEEMYIKAKKPELKKDIINKIKDIDDTLADISREKMNITSKINERYSSKEKKLIETIFGLVYELYGKTNDRVSLVERVVKKLNRSR